MLPSHSAVEIEDRYRELLKQNRAQDAAAARCLQALRDFQRWSGPLAPHFAYGALDKAQYTRAHLMHLAHHWTDLAPA